MCLCLDDSCIEGQWSTMKPDLKSSRMGHGAHVLIYFVHHFLGWSLSLCYL